MVPAWTLQLARGILALGLGVTIALTLAHTPAFGLVTFGAFAVLGGAVLVLAGLRSGYGGRVRGLVLAHGAVSLLAGGLALVNTGADVRFLGVLVGIWALLAGAGETLAGILTRTTSPLARDWLITGVLTLVLGIVALVLPPDFVQTFTGDRGQAGTLTSSVILIGVIGAWAVLVGVLQTISAISVRGSRPALAWTASDERA